MTKQSKHLLSRPNRRAARRLAIKEAQYEYMCKNDKRGAIPYTKPGRGNHW